MITFMMNKCLNCQYNLLRFSKIGGLRTVTESHFWGFLDPQGLLSKNSRGCLTTHCGLRRYHF
jgi:hypothetical protein